MARALSVDLRDRIMAAIAGGLSRRQAAVRFGVSAASAVRWQQLANQHGRRRHSTGWRSTFDEDRGECRVDPEPYKATPDITLVELQALLADHGTEVALGTIWQLFARRGITRKTYSPPRLQE